MACFLVLLGLFAPRLALILVWLFTPLVSRAFGTLILLPVLGLIFLPLTTLVYVLVFIPGVGVVGLGWLWLILALLADLATYGGGYRSRARL